VERCEQSWPARPEHVGTARRAASTVARRAGAEAPILDAVQLAVSEAVSNVVLHSYRNAPRGDFTMAVEWEDGWIQVTVCDHGCGMKPRGDSPGAGLGLPLIATLTDSLSVTRPADGGTELCMTFPLRMLTAA
jgi:serine/threonine-protein kinase RsbW